MNIDVLLWFRFFSTFRPICVCVDNQNSQTAGVDLKLLKTRNCSEPVHGLTRTTISNLVSKFECEMRIYPPPPLPSAFWRPPPTPTPAGHSQCTALPATALSGDPHYCLPYLSLHCTAFWGPTRPPTAPLCLLWTHLPAHQTLHCIAFLRGTSHTTSLHDRPPPALPPTGSPHTTALYMDPLHCTPNCAPLDGTPPHHHPNDHHCTASGFGCWDATPSSPLHIWVLFSVVCLAG